MFDAYDGVIEVACPYENCGAGPGAKCIVHGNDGSRTLRDSPHVVRVRKADPDPTEEEQDLLDELQNDIENV